MLVDDFLTPEVAPGVYTPELNIVAWKAFNEGAIILEVFKRKNGTLGYQYRAWVAWRDAGNDIRGHGWHEIGPRMVLISDCLREACSLADDDAAELGLEGTSVWVIA